MVIENFFVPKSIAIIGASNEKSKVGYSLIKNLEKFKGKVFPINIKRKIIQGRKAFKSVLDVKEKIDLAVIAIPSKFVKKSLEECGKKQIKAAIIISAGYSEIGNIKEEQELIEIANKYKIRIMGPNCFGNVNPYINLDTSFSLSMPQKGEIAFIAQSGALWISLVEYSLNKFGFSGYASLGNMIDIDFADCIEYFNKDKNTKVILCYIEALKDGRKFMKIAKKTKKPIILVKVGKSDAGAKAALSHTGALAGSYEIYKAAFKQGNVIISDSLTEALDKAQFLAEEHILGDKVIIVTNGGGSGVMAADLCGVKNLNVIKLPKNLLKELNKTLPYDWSHNNPIDIVGSSSDKEYKNVFLKLEKYKKYFDFALVILNQQKMIDTRLVAKEIINFRKRSKKGVVAILIGGKETEKASELLHKSLIPNFFDIDRAVNTLKGLK